MQGYPIGKDGGTPFSGLRRGTLHPDLEEVPNCPNLGRGITHPDLSPGQEEVGTPNWNNIACTCYAAGGMPLAFTQEDFLVLILKVKECIAVGLHRCTMNQGMFCSSIT